MYADKSRELTSRRAAASVAKIHFARKLYYLAGFNTFNSGRRAQVQGAFMLQIALQSRSMWVYDDLFSYVLMGTAHKPPPWHTQVSRMQ